MQTRSGNNKSQGERESTAILQYCREHISPIPSYFYKSKNQDAISLSLSSVRSYDLGGSHTMTEHFFNLDKIWVQSPNTVILDVKKTKKRYH